MPEALIGPLIGQVAGGLFGGDDAPAQATQQATQTSNAAAEQAARTAQEMWDYYKSNYQPLESNLISQAQKAGAPEEFARARGAANADVTGAFDTAKKTAASRMQSFGINPGSPAYQSMAASADLAEGATKAGALTAADNNTRSLAYSKALDVVGLGRNIPAQSAASAGNAAGAAGIAARSAQIGQGINNQNAQNTGYGVGKITNAAKSWFNTPSQSTGGYGGSSGGGSGGAFDWTDSSGNVMPEFAKGGKVGLEHATIDAEKTGDGTYDATALKGVLQKKGLNPRVAHEQAHGAHKRQMITPHMKRFASGGGVGTQGLETNDASSMGELQGPGTGTSDSIPAQIDGQQPAALSTGEVVVNAEAVNLTGDEILQAINEAGLKKRQQHGMEPRTSNEVPVEAGMEAYAEGGKVFDPEGKDYDYKTAMDAGLKPDATGHWSSREPESGQILKGRKHPTYSKTEQGEREAGYGIMRNEKDKKYYSVDSMRDGGYARGGRVQRHGLGA